MFWTKVKDLSQPKVPPADGWLSVVNRHHDHVEDHFPGTARFPRTEICDLCNNADAAAKRALGIPRWFSFSPEEIGRFVAATPHGLHVRDDETARVIFRAIHPDIPLKGDPL